MSETYPFCLKFFKNRTRPQQVLKHDLSRCGCVTIKNPQTTPLTLTLDSKRFLKFPQINDLWILNFKKKRTREEDSSMKEITLKLNRSDNLNFIYW